MHERDALLQLGHVLDDRGLGDAERGVLDGGFHEQWKLQAPRHLQPLPPSEHVEQRCWNAVIGQQLFGQRLVARQQQAARIAAGVALPQQLEKRHDVLIVRDDTVEFLEQVEDDVGLPVGDGGAQLREAVQHADAVHVVTDLAQRRGHVVLSAPLLNFLFSTSFESFRRHQARVHHDERAHFFHTFFVPTLPASPKLAWVVSYLQWQVRSLALRVEPRYSF